MLTTLVLIGILVAGYVFCYNGLVSSKLKVDEGWAGITVQLKRRHELVPNLVTAAQTAMSHERGILDKILDARRLALRALASGDHQEVNEAESTLTSALRSFVSYTEDNPEMTSIENVHLLQKQLEETEDQIAASRRLFNGNVQAYNARVLCIPWNFIANVKGFRTEPMFEVDQNEIKVISKPSDLAAMARDDGGTT